MERLDLPPDLQEMERRLSSRQGAGPSADHRDRVLAAVRGERAQRRVSLWQRRGAWQVAAVAVAVAVLWVNVAVRTVGEGWAIPTEATNGRTVRKTAEAIRSIVPQLTEREALREALLLRAGVAVTAVPRSAGAARDASSLAHWKEVRSWVSQ